MPVDWVSAVTAHIYLHSHLHGQTYHLTPLQPVTARDLCTALTQSFKLYGPRFVGPDALSDCSLNELEKMFYELHYELNNRPDWVRIPLRHILLKLEADSPQARSAHDEMILSTAGASG